MNAIIIIWLTFTVFGIFLPINYFVNCAGICYGSGKYTHCFSNEPPFDALPLPQDAATEIMPTYHLYRSLSSAIGGYARRAITSSNELRNLAENGLVVVIHGWMGDFPNTETWQTSIIRNILLIKPQTDVLFVEWAKGANLKFGTADPYAQPAANTRSIAAVVGDFLLENEHFDSMKCYCIGFSVGAHICGFLGKRFKQSAGMDAGWARVSGLDPAYPYFDTPNAAARLDKNDALYVDIVHTSRLGLERPIGHADFYVSGAVYQPGCATFLPSSSPTATKNQHRHRRHVALANFVQEFTGAIEELFACSHLRAPLIFAETIVNNNNSTSPCSFNTFCPCETFADFSRGKCSNCPPSERHTIGYWSVPENELPKSGTFYGELDSKAPFCVDNNK